MHNLNPASGNRLLLAIVLLIIAAGAEALWWSYAELTKTEQLGAENPALNLSIDQGDIVRSTKIILGTSEEEGTPLKLRIDGKPVTVKRVMEQTALLTFETVGVKAGADSVWINDQQIHLFDKDMNEFAKVSVPVPAVLLKEGDNQLSFRTSELSEANQWRIRAVKFELSDGTVLDDPGYKTATVYPVGGAAASRQDFKYTVKAEKYRTVYYAWNTTETADGSHKLELTGEVNGNKMAKAVTVQVDNTPPKLELLSPIEGRTYKNKVSLTAKLADGGSGSGSIVAKLDDKPIEIPVELETAELSAGNHKLAVTASDLAGNVMEAAVTFQTLTEMPEPPSAPNPADRALVAAGQAQLSVTVKDSSEHPMNVTFYKAKRYDLAAADKHPAYSNAADREPPLEKIPAGESPLTEQQRALIAAKDGRYLVRDDKERFPYHRFSFELTDALSSDAEVVWTGHSLPDRLVTLYVWNYAKGKWQELDSNRGTEDFTLRGTIIPALMARDGRVEVLVQDRIPSPGDYDFAFAWMTDTQYYAESFPNIFDMMTRWTIDHWNEKKFSYLIHTGDIVNNWNSKIEWERASASMKTLDDARIPYGVVAGNHDVAYEAGIYDEYWKYFGRERFASQPTFGGDLNNNRDHYDLISVKGNDFVILYLGWLIDEKSFDWANVILRKYAHRNAIIVTHEYLKPNKAYFGQGKSLREKLVVPNPNVIMVLGGHNPGTAYNVKKIGDRTVVEMLSDYQNGPEGGQGFMRLLQFDLTRKRLLVNTYSPYLNKWNFFKPEEDEFEVPLTLRPIDKQVATDYIALYDRTNEVIGRTDRVANGNKATVMYPQLQPGQTYAWYAVAKDEFGGQSKSEVWTLETAK